MLDVRDYLPARRKQTPSGWISFNCPVCQEKRSRGGIKVSDQGWSFHCFNCNYTASFILGRNLSIKARQLLKHFNVPERDIEMLNLESLKHRSIHGMLEDRQRVWNQLAAITFEERDLPPHASLLADEIPYRGYVRSRAVPDDYPIMIQA